MALRIASILGAGCLSLQYCLALGDICVVDEKEYFPLSGGIDNGVQVTIKVAAIAGNFAKIQFVDRERKGAFVFEIDTANKQISRYADASFNGATETFGGWPSGLEEGAHTFIFTKRKFDIALSIQTGTGEVTRYPWYDYSNLQENGVSPLLTHVAVHCGLSDPEVTLTRPQCEQQCHPDECRDASGTSVCDGPDATGCFTVEMGEAPGVAMKCQTLQTTKPSGNMHCCDGVDVTPKARGALAVETWAVVTNLDYLKRICLAFGISSCPREVAGSFVQVKENTGSNEYKLFAPVKLASPTDGPDHDLPADSFVNLPPFAFFESFSNPKANGSLARPYSVSTFNADAWHDIITTASAGLEGNLQKGYYIHLVDWYLDGPRRTKYTRTAKTYLEYNSSVVYASARPLAPPDCDDRTLIDADGRSCLDYNETVCTRHGWPTPLGCKLLYDPPKEDCTSLPGGTDDGIAESKDAAALSCCICGGGTAKLPSDWSSHAESLVVVM